jgi:hypothetical protein
MPELTPEPDSTGGEKKKRDKCNNFILGYSFTTS